MRLLEIHGRHLPGIGEVRFRPRGQLVGLTGPLAPRFGELLARAVGSVGRESPAEERGGLPSIEIALGGEGGTIRLVGPGVRGPEGEAAFRELSRRVGVPGRHLGVLWAGSVTPDELLEGGMSLLLDLHGAARAPDLLERLRAGDGEEGADDPALRIELSEIRERIARLKDVPERLRRLEDELRSLRGDHVEIEGELEVATMDWLRERQDAETHLQTYRDQARELRDRLHRMRESGSDEPCPTCGRPLADHFDTVVERLQEEWEDIVQDGKWWRRRREQLDLKPESLQEIEGKVVRSQAEMEATSEQLERCRFELRDLDELRARERDLLARMAGADTGSSTALTGAGIDAAMLASLLAESLDDLRRELRAGWLLRAAGVANAISGGTVLGVREVAGRVEAVGGDGTPAIGGLAPIAMHLALAEWAAERGHRIGSLLIDLPFADEAPGILERIRRRLTGGPLKDSTALAITRSEVVGRAPETVHQVVEIDSGGFEVRAGGATRWTLAGAAGPSRR